MTSRKGYTLFDKKVINLLSKIHHIFEDIGIKYATNGGIAVQLALAYPIVMNGEKTGDILGAQGLRRIYRATDDIDLVICWDERTDAIAGIVQGLRRAPVYQEEKARGQLVQFGGDSIPRIDLWIGKNKFDKRMIEEAETVRFKYGKKLVKTNMPPLEYIVALKLLIYDETRHLDDLKKIKGFVKAGILHVEERSLEKLLQLRKENVQPYITAWQNL